MSEEEIRQEEDQPEHEQEREEIQAQEDQNSEVIQKAKTHGHIDKEEWVRQGKDPDRWKSPEEFVEFGDSYTKLKPHLDMLKKEISKRDSALEAMVNHINEVREKEYLRGRSEVEDKLKIAKEMGDLNAVESLTRDKVQLELQQQQTAQKRFQEEQQRLEQEFIEKNKHWYNQQHPELMQEMQYEVGKQRQISPQASNAEILNRAETEMRYRHTDIVSPGITRQHITPSQSSINKSEYESRDSEDRYVGKLSPRDKQDYLDLKEMVERVPGIKYTVKEFLSQQKDYKQRSGE